jgi:hypothetical protein
VLDTWPDAIWTTLASTVGGLQGSKLVTAITDTIMKLGDLAGKFEKAVAGALGIIGLASDLVSLIMSMSKFDATLTNTQPFERTPHTGDPGGTTTLSATLTQGAASQSGLLNCVLRIVGAPFGIDASKFTGGPINNALVGLSLVGNPPVTIGGQGPRTDGSGVAHATLTGDPQPVDKTGQPTYNRGVGVKVVVHPATKDGTSATGAVINALVGDTFAVLGGDITEKFVDQSVRTALRPGRHVPEDLHGQHARLREPATACGYTGRFRQLRRQERKCVLPGAVRPETAGHVSCRRNSPG